MAASIQSAAGERKQRSFYKAGSGCLFLLSRQIHIQNAFVTFHFSVGRKVHLANSRRLGPLFIFGCALRQCSSLNVETVSRNGYTGPRETRHSLFPIPPSSTCSRQKQMLTQP